MWQKWQAFKIAFWNWMRQSGTIAWARLQILIGILFTVLSTVDASPLFINHPMWLVWYLIIVGFVTEYIRRRGSEIQTTQTYIPDYGNVEVKTLVKAKDTNPPCQSEDGK